MIPKLPNLQSAKLHLGENRYGFASGVISALPEGMTNLKILLEVDNLDFLSEIEKHRNLLKLSIRLDTKSFT